MKNIKFIILLLIFCLCGCSGPKSPNHLDSDDYNTQEERVATLKHEIKSNSDFDDTEFELFNVNGFSNSRTTIPGASSWDYKFAIKVKKSDMDKWVEGMVKIEPTEMDLNWTREITKKRKDGWVTTGLPEIYKRGGDDVIVLLYRTEGILFKRVINL